MKKITLLTLLVFCMFSSYSQMPYQREYAVFRDAQGAIQLASPMVTITDANIYRGGEKHEVKYYEENPKSNIPKNIILMIGDGMGTSQIFAGLVANGGELYLNNFKHVGFSQTQASSTFNTDSGAGGTALSTGKRTYYHAIGVDPDTIPQKTVLEFAEEKGMATGLVATIAITHATPASFIAHEADRNSYENIAADFMNTDVDVFIGGGYKYFADRSDSIDLTLNLKENGYQVVRSMDEAEKINSGKLACFTDSLDPGRAPQRHNLLPRASKSAINILQKDDDGFFIMIEGSQIDSGGHANSTSYIVEEMLDFDKAIGEVLEFAAKDRETLVIITADHETGGFSVIDGDKETGRVTGLFTWGDHTATMVPVFAFGPGAEQFSGIMQNTDIADKIFSFMEEK